MRAVYVACLFFCSCAITGFGKAVPEQYFFADDMGYLSTAKEKRRNVDMINDITRELAEQIPVEYEPKAQRPVKDFLRLEQEPLSEQSTSPDQLSMKMHQRVRELSACLPGLLCKNGKGQTIRVSKVHRMIRNIGSKKDIH